ncbi:hypothetical protein [Actinomadura sp. 6N118]|uniref:hypothetical protein n=1 Tax=Actinomadura sp. 6N118 TaxID=3375151 RepID=UPI00379C8191
MRFAAADVRSGADAAETWPVLSRLLAATPWARRSPDGGDNFPDGRRLRFAVGQDVPAEPSTVSIYATGADGTTTGRLLVADFDVSRAAAAGAADPAGLVATEAAAFADLVERCGGRVVHDVSPSQGRHVYLKFRQAVPFEDLRMLARALAERYTTLDPAPMLNPSGQIRIAGSPYKRTPVEQADGSFKRTGPLLGFMALTMPLAAAEAVLRRPCGPRVLERLQQVVTAELAAADPAPSLSAPLPGVQHLDGSGRPWVPLRGGRRALPPRLAELAVTGGWDAPRLQPDGKPYASRSEARYAVLRSAAAGGWTLTEVQDATRPGGAFEGLDALLGSRSPAQRRAVLTSDWDRAVKQTHASRPLCLGAHNLHTSSATHPPHNPSSEHPSWPIPRTLAEAPARSARQYQELTRWTTAVYLSERDPIRSKGWGRRAPSTRLVLRALALAARLSGSTTTAFGCRSLALAAGLSWRTVALVLADLREEDDPLVDLVERGREKDADRYALRIPDGYRAESARTIWQAGRIETGHPAFLELGPVCALVYEALSDLQARPVDLERRAVLSSGAVAQALADLGAHGLAVRGPYGWRRGETTLDQVAGELQAFDRFTERVQLYRDHRADWHAFVESVRPLAAAWRDLEAAFAEHDRYFAEHHIAVPSATEAAEPAAEHQDRVDPAAPATAMAAPVIMVGAIPAPRPPAEDGRATVPSPRARGQGPATAVQEAGRGPVAEPDGSIQPSPLPPPASEIITAHGDSHAAAAARGAALARRLLAEAREE